MRKLKWKSLAGRDIPTETLAKEMQNFVFSQIHSRELFSLKDFFKFHIYEHKSRIYRKRFFMVLLKLSEEEEKFLTRDMRKFHFLSLLFAEWNTIALKEFNVSCDSLFNVTFVNFFSLSEISCINYFVKSTSLINFFFRIFIY